MDGEPAEQGTRKVSFFSVMDAGGGVGNLGAWDLCLIANKGN